MCRLLTVVLREKVKKKGRNNKKNSLLKMSEKGKPKHFNYYQFVHMFRIIHSKYQYTGMYM